jgi:hypothetical protein
MAYISRLLHTCDRAFESRAIVLPVLFRPNSISTYKFSKQDAIEELLCTECRDFFCLLGKQSDLFTNSLSIPVLETMIVSLTAARLPMCLRRRERERRVGGHGF